MESAGLVLDALGRVRDMVREALKYLSPEELLAPPKPHIAWLVWHLTRSGRQFLRFDRAPAVVDHRWLARALRHAARS
jgi:hypothetical protein